MRTTNPGHNRLARPINLDIGHHASVFMLEHVAVKHELPDHDRAGKRQDQLYLAHLRHQHRIDKALILLLDAIDFHNLERELMDVEFVKVLGLIADCPFLDIAELHTDIDPVTIE
jgi:hypothetical protein